MKPADVKRLDDIRRMCVRIAGLVARGRAAFDDDPALWWALERCIEIAGEAANHLSDQTRAAYPSVEWRGLIGVRVLIVHAYHRTVEDQIWQIATTDMPALAAALGSADQT